MSSARTAPRLLFVPVSGAYGMGEYARSLAIARGARDRWPQAAIRFLLSRQAPYAADAPFETTLLPDSPTRCTPGVLAAIAAFAPHVVIFDNAGRSAQLRAARAAGAAVVFISARRRQRRRAGRLSWLRLIDEHWMAYPRRLGAPSGPFEGWKRRCLRRPPPRHLDVMLPRADGERRAALLAELALPAAPVLVVPGGGTGHPGAMDAVRRFHSAAVELATAGVPTVFVGPFDAADAAEPGALRRRRSLPQADLAELMRAASVVVANGGSTMVQAIACAAPCIAVPIARDQRARIRRAAAAGVVVRAPLAAAAIARGARLLLADAAARTALASRAADFALADGIQVAVDALAGLCTRRADAAPRS
ncbi:MAG TPA: hypothetical protein VMU86_06660 [Steroidobacteraceae bacterium]|nr:hypothetical protein [Steroidobacteraceae bacterium]